MYQKAFRIQTLRAFLACIGFSKFRSISSSSSLPRNGFTAFRSVSTTQILHSDGNSSACSLKKEMKGAGVLSVGTAITVFSDSSEFRKKRGTNFIDGKIKMRSFLALSPPQEPRILHPSEESEWNIRISSKNPQRRHLTNSQRSLSLTTAGTLAPAPRRRIYASADNRKSHPDSLFSCGSPAKTPRFSPSL